MIMYTLYSCQMHMGTPRMPAKLTELVVSAINSLVIVTLKSK